MWLEHKNKFINLNNCKEVHMNGRFITLIYLDKSSLKIEYSDPNKTVETFSVIRNLFIHNGILV